MPASSVVPGCERGRGGESEPLEKRRQAGPWRRVLELMRHQLFYDVSALGAGGQAGTGGLEELERDRHRLRRKLASGPREDLNQQIRVRLAKRELVGVTGIAQGV